MNTVTQGTEINLGAIHTIFKSLGFVTASVKENKRATKTNPNAL